MPTHRWLGGPARRAARSGTGGCAARAPRHTHHIHDLQKAQGEVHGERLRVVGHRPLQRVVVLDQLLVQPPLELALQGHLGSRAPSGPQRAAAGHPAPEQPNPRARPPPGTTRPPARRLAGSPASPPARACSRESAGGVRSEPRRGYRAAAPRPEPAKRFPVRRTCRRSCCRVPPSAPGRAAAPAASAPLKRCARPPPPRAPTRDSAPPPLGRSQGRAAPWPPRELHPSLRSYSLASDPAPLAPALSCVLSSQPEQSPATYPPTPVLQHSLVPPSASQASEVSPARQGRQGRSNPGRSLQDLIVFRDQLYLGFFLRLSMGEGSMTNIWRDISQLRA